MNMKNTKLLAIAFAFASLLTGCQSGQSVKTGSTQASADRASVTSASPASPQAAEASTNSQTAPIADNNTLAPTASNGSAQPPNAPKVSKASNVKAAPMPQPEIGSGGNDLLLFTQMRHAIDTDGDLKRANILIDIKNSIVTLNGTVADDAQKSRAEQLVKEINGIKSVKNQLKISSKKANPSS